MIIRVAALSDAEVIAGLVTGLGYASTAAQVQKRLAAMGRDHAALAVVAEEEGGQVTGLATAHGLSTIHADKLVFLLTSLAVAEASRRRGVGRALVEHVEAWARFQGGTRLSVVTGTQRLDAHAFYEQLGFARTGFRFVKELGPGG